MEIRAYNKEYLNHAQMNLGNMFDFAVVTLRINLERFSDMFLTSDVSRQLASGNPSYVAGRNGCELARLVLETSGAVWQDHEDAMYLDKSPEYWAGWSLAYYQWKRAMSFQDILDVVPITDFVMMYHPYHEMDIEALVELLDKRMLEQQAVSRLKFYRKQLALTQAELARRSDVPIRQIQLFEQHQRDINKTQVETIVRLSKALHCRIEDLLE